MVQNLLKNIEILKRMAGVVFLPLVFLSMTACFDKSDSRDYPGFSRSNIRGPYPNYSRPMISSPSRSRRPPRKPRYERRSDSSGTIPEVPDIDIPDGPTQHRQVDTSVSQIKIPSVSKTRNPTPDTDSVDPSQEDVKYNPNDPQMMTSDFSVPTTGAQYIGSDGTTYSGSQYTDAAPDDLIQSIQQFRDKSKNDTNADLSNDWLKRNAEWTKLVSPPVLRIFTDPTTTGPNDDPTPKIEVSFLLRSKDIKNHGDNSAPSTVVLRGDFSRNKVSVLRIAREGQQASFDRFDLKAHVQCQDDKKIKSQYCFNYLISIIAQKFDGESSAVTYAIYRESPAKLIIDDAQPIVFRTPRTHQWLEYFQSLDQKSTHLSEGPKSWETRFISSAVVDGPSYFYLLFQNAKATELGLIPGSVALGAPLAQVSSESPIHASPVSGNTSAPTQSLSIPASIPLDLLGRFSGVLPTKVNLYKSLASQSAMVANNGRGQLRLKLFFNESNLPNGLNAIDITVLRKIIPTRPPAYLPASSILPTPTVPTVSD